jgi:hypothetical protein
MPDRSPVAAAANTYSDPTMWDGGAGIATTSPATDGWTS